MNENQVRETIAAYTHQHAGDWFLIICDGAVLIEDKAALVAAGMTVTCSDVLNIHIEKNRVIEKPLHLIYLSADQTKCITLAAESQLTLIEAYLSSSMTTQTKMQVTVQENAALHYYKTQEAMHANRLVTELMIDQAAHSNARLLHLLKSTSFSQHRVTVNLNGEHAYCHASGFAETTHDDHHIDQQIEINHIGQHSQSDLYYKGLLDKKSRMIFNGRVHVAKEAQKIAAYQENHHLLLAANAEVYTKPELEIYADDITCKHGATVGEMDEEALFYLQSRGIARENAIALLIKGFASDILKNIQLPSLLTFIEKEVSHG